MLRLLCIVALATTVHSQQVVSSLPQLIATYSGQNQVQYQTAEPPLKTFTGRLLNGKGEIIKNIAKGVDQVLQRLSPLQFLRRLNPSFNVVTDEQTQVVSNVPQATRPPINFGAHLSGGVQIPGFTLTTGIGSAGSAGTVTAGPAASVVIGPAAPVVGAPAAPVVGAPAAPVVGVPAAPVVAVPAAPVVGVPAAPVVVTPAAPVVVAAPVITTTAIPPIGRPAALPAFPLTSTADFTTTNTQLDTDVLASNFLFTELRQPTFKGTDLADTVKKMMAHLVNPTYLAKLTWDTAAGARTDIFADTRLEKLLKATVLSIYPTLPTATADYTTAIKALLT